MPPNGNEANLQLAGRGRAVGVGIKVECQREMGTIARCGGVNSEAGNKMIDVAANSIDRYALWL